MSGFVVAVLSLQRLGDTLTAARVTRALATHPEVSRVEVIHWEQNAQAAQLLPGVDALYPLPYIGLKQRSRIHPLAPFAVLRDHVRALQERGYHRLVNLSSTRPACLLAPLIAPGGGTRGPYLDADGRYRGSHPALEYFNDWGTRPDINVFTHQDVFATAAGIPLETPATLLPHAVHAARAQAMIDQGRPRPIAIQIHSSDPRKDWRGPSSFMGWLGLCNELRRRFDAPIVLLGAPSEEEVLSTLARRTGARLCLWPLPDCAALLQRCQGLVSVDTVAIHLAALVGCPSIVLRQGPARGRAFVPGAGALLVDEALRTASVDDLAQLCRAHFYGRTLPSRVARDLARRLQVRSCGRDGRGYLTAVWPRWLPASLRAAEEDRAEAAWRDYWHRRWHGDALASQTLTWLARRDPVLARRGRAELMLRGLDRYTPPTQEVAVPW